LPAARLQFSRPTYVASSVRPPEWNDSTTDQTAGTARNRIQGMKYGTTKA
jgi:hypothetical protein